MTHQEFAYDHDLAMVYELLDQYMTYYQLDKKEPSTASKEVDGFSFFV